MKQMFFLAITSKSTSQNKYIKNMLLKNVLFIFFLNKKYNFTFVLNYILNLNNNNKINKHKYHCN